MTLHDSDWWLHQLHDQLLAAGVQVTTTEVGVGQDTPVSASVFALTSQEDLTISAGEFHEDGFVLENTADRHMGYVIHAQWITSLAQLSSNQWRGFMSQWPMQVDHLHINERGMVVMGLRMARLSVHADQ